MEELPEEVTFTPVPYVAFIGLGEKNNDIHCHIWNTFAINRSSDRPLLYYKQISVTDKFPLAKERVFFWILFLIYLTRIDFVETDRTTHPVRNHQTPMASKTSDRNALNRGDLRRRWLGFIPKSPTKTKFYCKSQFYS